MVACNAEFLKSISMRWLATLKTRMSVAKKKKLKSALIHLFDSFVTLLSSTTTTTTKVE